MRKWFNVNSFECAVHCAHAHTHATLFFLLISNIPMTRFDFALAFQMLSTLSCGKSNPLFFHISLRFNNLQFTNEIFDLRFMYALYWHSIWISLAIACGFHEIEKQILKIECVCMRVHLNSFILSIRTVNNSRSCYIRALCILCSVLCAWMC